MSMEDSEQDKSERATPYKLAHARRKGVVARGADLGFLAALVALYAFLWLRGQWTLGRLEQMFQKALVVGPQVQDGAANLISVIAFASLSMAAPLLMLIGLIFAFALVLELAQTGFVFSTTPLRLDFGKLNPAKGLKRVFSKQMLIELGKTLLKLVTYSALTVMAITNAASGIAQARTPPEMFEILSAAVLRFLLHATIAAALLAALDQFLARRTFAQRMRMSRREVRREHKDREGDPRQKQERKRLHAEYAKNSRSLRGVQGADALIVNPLHFAVALRYEPNSMIAPKVTARGRDAFALRLKRLAMLYRVPIVEDAPLARLLYRVDMDRMIPEAAYDRVAEIYRRLDGMKQIDGRITP